MNRRQAAFLAKLATAQAHQGRPTRELRTIEPGETFTLDGRVYKATGLPLACGQGYVRLATDRGVVNQHRTTAVEVAS